MGTDFLFAKPNFLSGMASAMDLGGTLVSEYNSSFTPNAADFRALKSDWAVVGMDIEDALKRFAKDHVKEKR